MKKEKACKQCKHIMDNTVPSCPICKNNAFSTNFQGRIAFIDVRKSKIAKEMGVEEKGEYALKVY